MTHDLNGEFQILNVRFKERQINMQLIRSAAMWIVWNVPIGSFAPMLMSFALNSTKCSRVLKTSKGNRSPKNE